MLVQLWQIRIVTNITGDSYSSTGELKRFFVIDGCCWNEYCLGKVSPKILLYMLYLVLALGFCFMQLWV